MSRLLPILIAFAAVAWGGGAAAQVSPDASITIREAVAISSMRPMRLQAIDADSGVSLGAVGGQADAPAVVQVTGDPGSVYRIRVPEAAAAEGVVVEALEVHSLTSGDITGEGVARMSAEGRDVLTISGRLRLATADGVENAPLMIAIAYE